MTDSPGEIQREERLRGTAALLKLAGGDLETVLVGASMGAAIPDGSAIRIRCRQGQRFGVGEVVAVPVGQMLVVHRIVYCAQAGRARDYLITRGDTRWFPDSPVHTDQVLGAVEAVRGPHGWEPPVPGPPPRQPTWAWSLPVRILATTLERNVRIAIGLTVMVAMGWQVRAALSRTFRRLVGRPRSTT